MIFFLGGGYQSGVSRKKNSTIHWENVEVNVNEVLL